MGVDTYKCDDFIFIEEPAVLYEVRKAKRMMKSLNRSERRAGKERYSVLKSLGLTEVV